MTSVFGGGFSTKVIAGNTTGGSGFGARAGSRPPAGRGAKTEPIHAAIRLNKFIALAQRWSIEPA